ncbi:uncharacterized protein N7479_009602 [Penicillium vulpinum]|uniref:Uncharacterized protein n=1 Tax=Penicillium vulpinum TaxID=29845 RepID=A0A1V6RYJ3_9EURO|nr:uncharacterized protein N7479_009602 [Penicillium vulpinum]KAJ5951189.1 hypothetical protein N7479_009602 [Penicillium vulpinum]OQE06851.1 hypothetical protein PENVUL_c016G05995 [Penicillium vulpinum]
MGQFSPFIRYSAADRPSGSPRLTLTLQAKSDLDIEVEARCFITIIITRDADDPQGQPCIIHWDPIEDGFGQSGMMLLQYNYPHTNELQHLQPDLEQLPAKSLHPREVNTSDPCFKELNPGASVSWEVALPSVYFDFFQVGKFYNIFWPGSQIPLWDWGTLAEHSNRSLGPKSPAAILPSKIGRSLSITAEESDIDDVGPLPPSPKPLLAPARMSGAPIFSLSIAGSATLSMKDRTQRGELRYPITATLSYDTAPDAYDGKPVTFHAFKFEGFDRREDGFRLYFRKKDKDDWSPHELGGLFTHHDYRFSTKTPVNVGRNDQNSFVSLMPGESWSFTREVSDFPKNAAPGDKFRYGFKGAFIDWWDWGNLHDHQDTMVRVNGRVDPQDNGRRPTLAVPASNWVEFTLVE